MLVVDAALVGGGFAAPQQFHLHFVELSVLLHDLFFRQMQFLRKSFHLIRHLLFHASLVF
jgi:hypothetical protein